MKFDALVYEVVGYRNGKFICELDTCNSINANELLNKHITIYIHRDARIVISEKGDISLSKFYIIDCSTDISEGVLAVNINGKPEFILNNTSDMRIRHILFEKYRLDLSDDTTLYKIDIIRINNDYETALLNVDIIDDTGIMSNIDHLCVMISNMKTYTYKNEIDITGLSIITKNFKYFNYTVPYVTTPLDDNSEFLINVNANMTEEGMHSLRSILKNVYALSPMKERINDGEDDNDKCNDKEDDIVIYKISKDAQSNIKIFRLSNVKDINTTFRLAADFIYFEDSHDNTLCATKSRSLNEFEEVVDNLWDETTFYQFTTDKELAKAIDEKYIGMRGIAW